MDNNYVINIIFIILALIGYILSIVFYLRSRKIKKPCYKFAKSELIQSYVNSIEGLEIFFDNNKIDNLSLTSLAFWNEGNEVINGADVAIKNKLKVIANEDVSILTTKLDIIENPSNNFTINFSKEEKIVLIDFDFVGQYEGIILKLYHSGDTKTPFRFEGEIKGVKIIQKDYLSTPIYVKKLYIMYLLYILPIMLSGILVSAFFANNYRNYALGYFILAMISAIFLVFYLKYYYTKKASKKRFLNF
jgi:hypothetical protein